MASVIAPSSKSVGMWAAFKLTCLHLCAPWALGRAVAFRAAALCEHKFTGFEAQPENTPGRYSAALAEKSLVSERRVSESWRSPLNASNWGAKRPPACREVKDPALNFEIVALWINLCKIP